MDTVMNPSAATVSVPVPFQSPHTAMGVVGSLSARTRHLSGEPAVEVETRRNNVVVFTGKPDALRTYLHRLHDKGLLSPAVRDSLLARIAS